MANKKGTTITTGKVPQTRNWAAAAAAHSLRHASPFSAYSPHQVRSPCGKPWPCLAYKCAVCKLRHFTFTFGPETGGLSFVNTKCWTQQQGEGDRRCYFRPDAGAHKMDGALRNGRSVSLSDRALVTIIDDGDKRATKKNEKEKNQCTGECI